MNNTTFSLPNIYSPTEVKIRISIFTIESIIGAIGNGLTVIALSKQKELQDPVDMLIASLAVSDLILTGILMPMYMIFPLITGQPIFYNETACVIVCWLFFSIALASTFHLLTICVNRYAAVWRPNWYSTAYSKLGLAGNIGACYLTAVCFKIWVFWPEGGLFYPPAYACIPAEMMTKELHMTNFVFFTTLAVVVITGMLIFYRILLSRKKVNDHKAREKESKWKLRKRERRVLLMLIIPVCIHMVTSGWFVIDFNFGLLRSGLTQTMADGFSMMCNVINPFAYAVFNKSYRQAYKSVLFCNSSIKVVSITNKPTLTAKESKIKHTTTSHM